MPVPPELHAETPVLGYVVLGTLALAVIATGWRVFAKAGRPGPFVLIPLYNLVVLCEIAGKPSWWAAMLLFPGVNLVFGLLVSLALATQFGRGTGFGLGLFFLPPIFAPLLAFGGAQYQGVRPQYFAARARA